MASCTASLVAPALRVSAARRTNNARRASRGPVRVRADLSERWIGGSASKAKSGSKSVEEFKGTGGLPAVKLTSKNGDTATAYLFGGVVTSFVKSGRDVLYVRPDAVFDKSKPISGGLPHCWPQFGPGDIQVHGFARNVDWALTEKKEGNSPSITMTLTPSDYTKAMWDKQFKVTQTITLSDGKLTATMKVWNLGEEAFSFTGSFHTYLSANIDEVAVGGMEGCTTMDRLAKKEGKVTGDIKITGPVDSVYYDVPKDITLAVGGGETVTVSGYGGWKDAVVWSPWTDMEKCYKEFVCVENAACAKPVVVAAGGEWEATTVLM
jgi:glucose-6-phosphate 1-epimerase